MSFFNPPELVDVDIQETTKSKLGLSYFHKWIIGLGLSLDEDLIARIMPRRPKYILCGAGIVLKRIL